MPNTMRIGLFGGSFDPVHNGHIKLARAAKNRFKLNRVIFIPSRQPPHKKCRKLTPKLHRLKMLQEALRPYPYFSISRFELNRKPTTYTYQTVKYFIEKHINAEIFFIMGSDSLAEIETWKNYKTLLSMCRILTGKRKGVSTGNLTELIDAKIPGVSSSEIRQKTKDGKPIRSLTPEPVARYIVKHKLYSKIY